MFLYTHSRHVTKVLPNTSISLGYTSSSTDKSVIMITTGKHGIQGMPERRLNVNMFLTSTLNMILDNVCATTYRLGPGHKPLQSRTLILQDSKPNKTRARLDYTRQDSQCPQAVALNTREQFIQLPE